VPARSLYEKITSKYVAAIFMYRNLLEPIEPAENRPGLNLSIGDRILVTVDGTLIPRQAIVKNIRSDIGMIYVHYIFWKTSHDEWLYTHSPRVRLDLPVPPDPPKNKGENMVTVAQVKGIVETEIEAMKKVDVVTDRGYWPKGIKKGAIVDVLIEGEWIHGAKVLEKNEMFCYCSFEYNGVIWNQDFPRESIRLLDADGRSVLDMLMDRKISGKKRSTRNGDTSTAPKKKRKIDKVQIEISPIKSAPKRIGVSDVVGLSQRAMRKQKRDASESIRPLWILTSPCEDATVPSTLNSPETVDTLIPSSSGFSEFTCSVCDDNHGLVLHCSTCEVSVHPSCYLMDPIKPLSANSWNCDMCVEMKLSGKKRLEGKCVCCNLGRSHGGVMAQTLTYKWIHVKCALMLDLEFFQKERRFQRFFPTSPKKLTNQPSNTCETCKSTTGTTFNCSFESCCLHAHVGCMNDWDIQVNCAGERDVKIFCPLHAKS
jgi:hypothetical protein